MPQIRTIFGIALLVVRPKPEFVVIALLLSLPLLLPRGRSWDESRYLAKLTVLDVGQGTAIVFQDHQQVLVYDTGGGDPAGFNMVTAVVLPYLRGEDITRIDTLVVSHPDNDHSAGAQTLLSSLPVGELIYGGEFPGSEVGRVCRAGEAWRWASGIRFQVMSPAREQGLSSNNSSCVLQIQAGKIRLLLPGDIDLAREKQLVRYWRDDLRSDWLLAAHHGSQSSSSIPWLKFVQPAMVAFSSGYGNSFGHPHPDIVRRISGNGSDLQSTSSGGALEYLLGADGQIRLRQYRENHKRYWH
jgi:competence protein ComEC